MHRSYLLDIVRHPNTTTGGTAAAKSAVARPLIPTIGPPSKLTEGAPNSAATPQIRKKPLRSNAARMTTR